MPTPAPWVLAMAAAFSAVTAVVVAFQAVSALREWRMRKDVLGSLKANDRERREALPQHSVVRARADEKEGFVRVLAERIPQLWDLHHLLGQSGLNWSLEGFLTRACTVATVTGLVVLPEAVPTPEPTGVDIDLHLGSIVHP